MHELQPGILAGSARTNIVRYRVQGLLLGEPPTDRPRRRAGGRAILNRPDHPYLNCASTCGAFEQVQFDVVNVDLHSARPGRGHIPCRWTDANIAKPSLSPIASHLLAEDFRTGAAAHPEVQRNSLAPRDSFSCQRAGFFFLT